jgi:hypothetical protein
MLAWPNSFSRSYAPGITSPVTSGPLSLVRITRVSSATPLVVDSSLGRPGQTRGHLPGGGGNLAAPITLPANGTTSP